MAFNTLTFCYSFGIWCILTCRLREIYTLFFYSFRVNVAISYTSAHWYSNRTSVGLYARPSFRSLYVKRDVCILEVRKEWQKKKDKCSIWPFLMLARFLIDLYWFLFHCFKRPSIMLKDFFLFKGFLNLTLEAFWECPLWFDKLPFTTF